MFQNCCSVFGSIAFALLVSTSANAAEGAPYSPYASSLEGKKLLWGDTHLHTTLSLDARAFGVELDPDTAFRFARGETVTSTQGQEVRLSRPLDFLVVSDHSDAMGTMSEIIKGNETFMQNEVVAGWHKSLTTATGRNLLAARMAVMTALTDGSAPALLRDRDFFTDVWNGYLEVTEAHNEPGRFTAIIGYEWTSSPTGNNLHRNVLYRDGADKAKQLLPFTSGESENPEDLWNWLANYEKQTGGQILAIAHNGNISNGLMFPEINPFTEQPLTKGYAETRARWEPLYEVTQIKGDTETHSKLSPQDEFADYESWDRGNFAGTTKTADMLPNEYAREALKRGLKLEQNLGNNPFQFGLIGSTDSHTGLATGEEDNFFGKMSYMEPSKDRWNRDLARVGEFAVKGSDMAGSGYAAVWAEDNTREAVFDAMMRRETYATTGPRMTVRFDAVLGEQVTPMGGKLKAQGDAAPTFTVLALKDPIGANLDRVQIVKGWVDSAGQVHEKVHNVSWAGKRKLNRKGRLKAVGNTVDVKTASYSNTIGAAQLEAKWQDPDFNPSLSAFYYARVLEIPTPRWTAYDAYRFGSNVSKHVPMTTQERAYTSPIWYQ